MTTDAQDKVADELASRYGTARILPMRDGTGAVVMQGLNDRRRPEGEALHVTAQGIARRATDREISRVFIGAQRGVAA